MRSTKSVAVRPSRGMNAPCSERRGASDLFAVCPRTPALGHPFELAWSDGAIGEPWFAAASPACVANFRQGAGRPLGKSSR